MTDEIASELGGADEMAAVLDALSDLGIRYVAGLAPDDEHDAVRLVDENVGISTSGIPVFSYSGLDVGRGVLLLVFSTARLRTMAEATIRKGLRADDPVMRLVGDVPEQVLLRLEAARMSPRLADALVRTSAEHLGDRILECVFSRIGPVSVRGDFVTALVPLPLSDRAAADLRDVAAVASNLVLFRS